jgi:hypothetical protein
MSFSTLVRAVRILLAVAVATVTFAVVASAVQTTVTPNATLVSYSLAPGAVSGPIFPAANISVLVTGTQLALGFRGIGHVALLRVPGSFLEWVGLDSTFGAAITQGFSGAAGTKIVFIDFSHQVRLEVASPDSFRVRNLSTGNRFGNVTLIW